jgi:hypothetical protein
MQRREYELAIKSFVLAIGIDPKTDYVRNLQSCMLKQREEPAANPPKAPTKNP